MSYESNPKIESVALADESIEELVAELDKTKKEVLMHGEKRLSLITQYYNTQLEFVDRIDKSIERGKKLLSADMVVRRKHAMSQQKISKRMAHFFKQVDGSYKKGDLHDKEGRVFARAYENASYGHFTRVRNILSELREMVELYEEFIELEKESKIQKTNLRRRKTAIQAVLEESKLVTSVDDDYVKKHEDMLQSLKRINEFRVEYLRKLRGKQVNEYVTMLKNSNLIKAGFPTVVSTNLIEFFNSYPELSEVTPEKLLEYESWTDGKLKHAIPDIKKFRSMMQEYGSWLERLKHLESSKFMVINSVEDVKKLAPLFEGTGAGNLLSKLSELGDYWSPPAPHTQVRDVTELKKELLQIDKDLALLENS